MKTLDHVVFVEPPRDEDVHVGAFVFDDPLTNEPTRAEFFIRTCHAISGTEFGEDASALVRRDQRVDDYNEQFAHQWEAYEHMGARNLKFDPIIPDPIFC